MRNFFIYILCMSPCFAALSLDEYYVSKGIQIQEGYITDGQKNQFREELSKHPEIRTIAEIGLNGGHSAEHFF
ncbi:MAG TPA: hypothetical protein VLE96_02240, partial [Chlamydiales bacterium]|nr:hypothetical protein [Chlamydiales bacterium]